MAFARNQVVIDDVSKIAIAGQIPAGLAAAGNVIWSATAIVASTFDPARTLSAALSNGNLTVTATSLGGITVSTSSRSAGKYHLEITVNSALVAEGSALGLVNPSGQIYYWLGSGANGGFGVWSGGRFAVKTYFNDVGIGVTGGGSGWTTGDTVAFEFDLDAKLLWFKNYTAPYPWNGSSTADPATGVGGISFSGLTGPYLFCANPYNGAAFTANFGATPFSVTPSSGFAPWR